MDGKGTYRVADGGNVIERHERCLKGLSELERLVYDLNEIFESANGGEANVVSESELVPPFASGLSAGAGRGLVSD